MYIVVNHRISDPNAFWSTAERELPNVPNGMVMHGSYPNGDGTAATCIWEASAVPQLRDYLEGVVGSYSDNEYMVVEPSKAYGLPVSKVGGANVKKPAPTY